MRLNHYDFLINSCAFMLLQNKTLSLNPAKKAVLMLRRPFGSETAESVSMQPVPVTDTPIHENDVPAKLDESSAPVTTDSQDEVHC